MFSILIRFHPNIKLNSKTEVNSWLSLLDIFLYQDKASIIMTVHREVLNSDFFLNFDPFCLKGRKRRILRSLVENKCISYAQHITSSSIQQRYDKCINTRMKVLRKDICSKKFFSQTGFMENTKIRTRKAKQFE